ncbi:hypothetical protein AGMMS50268_10380 [Spirochaetia bacterium]|nr:hypothetical protein AGMMS50268_10380 [Spirochaetia bacterium]
MKNKSIKFGVFIITLLALGSCLMPDLKPELYFGSSRKAPVENPPDSGSDSAPPATEAGPKFSTVPNFSIVPGGYTGPALITYYNPAATLNVTVTAAGTLEYDDSLTVPAGSIKSIELAGKKHLIGRDAPGAVSPIVLNLAAGGELDFRQPAFGGTPIGSYAEFQLINYNPAIMGQSYKQEADLDLMNEPWEPVGSSGSPFDGIYDGGGKTLSNLLINKSGAADPVGLFGVVSGGGAVRKVGILNGTVNGGGDVGGIAGKNEGAIFACSITGVVNGTGAGNVGGVAGSNTGNITACHNNAAVTGTGSYVGGVAGSSTGDITACYNTGAVNGNHAGGLVGVLDTSTFTACYNIGTVRGANFRALVGVIRGTILNVTDSYWVPGSGTAGVGGGVTQFPAAAQGFSPSDSSWGTGNGSGPGTYWKPGTVNGQDSVNLSNPPYPLPKLWFE